MNENFAEDGDAQLDEFLVGVCAKGGAEVTRLIKRLEANTQIPELKGIDDAVVASVLAELKTVMALYDGQS